MYLHSYLGHYFFSSKSYDVFSNIWYNLISFVLVTFVASKVAEACTEMEQYLRSQGINYNGEEEKEKEEDMEKADDGGIEVSDEVEEEVEDEESNAMKN